MLFGVFARTRDGQVGVLLFTFVTCLVYLFFFIVFVLLFLVVIACIPVYKVVKFFFLFCA